MLKNLINERFTPDHSVFTINFGQVLHLEEENIISEATNYKYNVSSGKRQRVKCLVYSKL